LICAGNWVRRVLVRYFVNKKKKMLMAMTGKFNVAARLYELAEIVG
jgi:hypothetical protein